MIFATNTLIVTTSFYVTMNKFDKDFDYTAPIQKPLPEPVLNITRRSKRSKVPVLESRVNGVVTSAPSRNGSDGKKK